MQAQPRARPTAARTSSRWAWCTGCTSGRWTPTLKWIKDKFAKKPARRRGQHAAPSRPATTTARRSSAAGPVPGRQGQDRARHVPQDHRQRGRRPRAWSPPPQLAGKPLVYASYPITPASRTSCTSWPSMKRFGVKTFQAEDEIAAIGAAIGASFGGAHRRHRHQRPGHLPQERGDRPGRDDRAAARHRRRAARRAEHRPADQDRAGRPAAGDVRPQRRVPGRRSSPRSRPADCFDMAFEAVRHRHPVHEPGVPPVRRLPRQRRRAVDDPGRRPSCRRSTIKHPTEPNSTAGRQRPRERQRRAGKFLPYKRDERLVAPVGHPRHAGPGAPHRRHREAGRHRQRQLRAGQPRAHGQRPGPRRSPTSPTTIPDLEVDGAADAATCWWSAGAAPTARSRRPSSAPGARG